MRINVNGIDVWYDPADGRESLTDRIADTIFRNPSNRAEVDNVDYVWDRAEEIADEAGM